MHKPWPVFLLLMLCFFSLPSAFSAVSPELAPDAAVAPETAYLPENSVIPAGLLELMNAARAKYLEGSALIKTGDTDQAQEDFNKAVDMILCSNWDLPTTPVLHRFFQDLIQRIQQDESSYLLVPFESDEEVESAAVDELESLDSIPEAIDPEIREALAADLAKTKYDIPITVNEMVLKSLDFWLNRNRKVFEAGLVRSGQYRPMIEKVFREESIPLDLMYLAQVESLFKPHALSRAKAKGIWQFGKGTAVRYGLKVTRDVDERADPEKSTRAAAHYLNDLFAMFKDWNLVLAAYNWGEGKIQRLVDKTGLNDFWQLVDQRQRIPEETKNHVPLIQASVILGRNPGKYGLTTQLDPPLQYSEVSVSKPIDLRAAAKVLSTSIEELKKLNPALRGNTTPANYPNFQLKVPLDSAPEVEEKLAALPVAKIKPAETSACRHKVRSGETLSGIAARYRIKVEDLRKANRLSAKRILRAGTLLNLPSCRADASKKLSAKNTASGKKSTKIAGKKSGVGRMKSAEAKSGISRKIKSSQAKNKATRQKSSTASLKKRTNSRVSREQIAGK